MSTAEEHAVEVSTVIAAEPATIFRFFTDPERFSQMLSAASQIDARPGGALAIDFTAHSTKVAGAVVEVVPNERIVFTWGVAEGAQAQTIPVGSTIVTVKLKPEGDGTRVTLRHSGLPSEEERQGHHAGWTHYLQQLARSAFEAQLGAGLPERIDAFCAAWSETDAAHRSQLLAQAVTDDFEYIDRHARVAGRGTFDAHIGTVQKMFADASVARESDPVLCHEFATYTWKVDGADGSPFGTGLSHVTLAGDGRARRIVAFWD